MGARYSPSRSGFTRGRERPQSARRGDAPSPGCLIHAHWETPRPSSCASRAVDRSVAVPRLAFPATYACLADGRYGCGSERSREYMTPSPIFPRLSADFCRTDLAPRNVDADSVAESGRVEHAPLAVPRSNLHPAASILDALPRVVLVEADDGGREDSRNRRLARQHFVVLHSTASIFVHRARLPALERFCHRSASVT
jgi:hypothetical protein